jgi:hypothetical protein
VALTEDGITYRRSVEDIGPSTSVSCPSTSWDDIGLPYTYMDITDSSSSWTSWGNVPNPSTSALNLLRAGTIIRYSYMLLYVMRIMNTCIVSLTLIKYYLIVIVGLILLLMIEGDMYCLYKLCFNVEKLTI